MSVTAGKYRARVALAGAALSAATYEGRDLIVPFDPRAPRPAMRGALLAPWPNRTADGAYEFAGETFHLTVNEPERGCASHGLVSDLSFTVREATPDTAVLAGELTPVAGYPWRLDITVSVSASDSGISHRVEIRNVATVPAPVGWGVHPYLAAGAPQPSAVDTWRLSLPADEVMLVDDVRLLPERTVHLDDRERPGLDFRRERRVGGAVLNHAYTALTRDGEGWARCTVVDGDGVGVAMAVDPAYRWIQAYSSDETGDEPARTGLALEPMTCPPDALNSHRDLVVLPPGESAAATFVLSAVGPQ